MKTNPITRTYTIWTCHNADHQHRNELVAQRCIDQHEKRKGKPTPTKKQRDRMNIRAAELLLRGNTMTTIAELEDVSPSTVANRVYKVFRLCRDKKYHSFDYEEEHPIVEKGKVVDKPYFRQMIDFAKQEWEV